MKYAALFAIGLIFSLTSFATQLIPLNVQLCGKVADLQYWTFENSGDVTNDVPDYQGYIRATFTPVTLEGRTVQTSVRFTVKNLVWDKKFQTLLFKGENGVTVCGKKTALGIRLMPACGLKFKAQEMVQSDNCENTEATNLGGVFFVD